MKTTDNDLIEITFNEKSNKWALWLNGKIIKLANKEKTILNFIKKEF